jgi:tRNA pseudouridine38-40 synthase
MATLLRVAYDGTDFHGYARQQAPEGQVPPRTVQGELEAALSRMHKQPITTRAASRTDAGVHARGQLVAFDPPFAIPPRGLLLGLASELPRDLIAFAAWEQPEVEGMTVEPRRQNLGKHYRYRIRTAQLRDPLHDRFEWHFPRSLDVAAMQAAASRFVGRFDFAGFRATDCQAKSTVRRMRSVEVSVPDLGPDAPADPGRLDPTPGRIVVDVRGDAFLKNMVRIMVGTLVSIGRGQFGPERIDEVLASGDRTRAGTTAPARGLELIEVLWPSSWPAPKKYDDDEGE